jgi:prophage DNA circulation protein
MTIDFWRPASFRGVPFFVESYGRSGGRRGPNHEFPGKDQGYPEDTGKKMEEFSVNAYVVRSVRDPDYAARRDALIAAANQYGPGELVHPAFGTIQVQLRSWSAGESKDSLGLVPIQLSFVEASDPAYPSATRPAASGVDAAAAAGHRAAERGFAEAFSVGGKSDFLRDRAAADAGKIRDAFSRMASSFGVPVDVGRLGQALDSAIFAADRTHDAEIVAGCVAAFPQAFAAWHEAPFVRRRNADGTYRGMGGRGGGPLAEPAVASLFRAFDFSLAVEVPVETAIRRQQADNSFALARLTRLASAIEAARVAPFVAWRTVQDAEAARDKIADALDRAAAGTASDELYAALTDLRVLVSGAIPPEESQLPSLMDYMPAVTQPTLALAYRLYGNADRADEIAAVNRIRHPGFVPGMAPLQVVSDAV